MSYRAITVSHDKRGVARITLAQPEKHNALSPTMITELTEVAGRLGADPAVRVVVLAAEGATFCAGGDLGWMQAQMAAPRAQRLHEARRLAQMLQALNTLPKPVIGRVQGNAFGGGVGLLAVCDVAIGVEGARFGLTEVRLGLIPATISPYVFARMGEGKARRVFFSGRLFEAEEAQALDLLAKVVPLEALESAVEAEIKPYLAAAPDALAAAKALTRALGPRIDEATIEESITRLADCWENPEAMEGVEAFFDRRKPGWAL